MFTGWSLYELNTGIIQNIQNSFNFQLRPEHSFPGIGKTKKTKELEGLA